ncbi:hypothetical protein AALO_G00221740 [Alosa alosa]|uniref:Uncharacterized protein n=1 Tax=Alosa alosa TaxID=278164 RepID=A0AAV6FX51_9TELE|nr:hypothetical protein AALO_G00221740 [Alosa alosa]
MSALLPTALYAYLISQSLLDRQQPSATTVPPYPSQLRRSRALQLRRRSVAVALQDSPGRWSNSSSSRSPPCSPRYCLPQLHQFRQLPRPLGPRPAFVPPPSPPP